MSYHKWATTDDVTLSLQLVSPTGLGVTGMAPEVSIRRIRATHAGALDGYFWNGATFQNTPVWLPMGEFDPVNSPGVYSYLFAQTLVGAEWVYLVYYRHTVSPVGFAIEEHIITDELFIPIASPAVPLLPGDSVMGRLMAMEDPTKPVALANADAVWDEILNQHLNPGSTGEALNRLTSVLNGTWQIEINTVEAGPIPLQGCQIDVFDSTNTFFLSRVYSDVNGKVNIAVNTGTYCLRIFKSGYSFTVPEILPVSGDGSVTYTGTTINIIVPPSNPLLCAIFGTLRDAGGQPMPNVKVKTAAIIPQVSGGTQKHEHTVCAVTDANGYFRIELERGTMVQLTADSTGLDVTKTVPNTPIQDLATWV